MSNRGRCNYHHCHAPHTCRSHVRTPAYPDITTCHCTAQVGQTVPRFKLYVPPQEIYQIIPKRPELRLFVAPATTGERVCDFCQLPAPPSTLGPPAGGSLHSCCLRAHCIISWHPIHRTSTLKRCLKLRGNCSA